jgi:glucosamine--fructose-6-phosphate aminotransferase (isomerizing)
MCGIVGYTGSEPAISILVEGLQKLEYRGYDSAGIAMNNGELEIIKSAGNIAKLQEKLPEKLEGFTGIAHTRWATHGEPNTNNAHPHKSFNGELTMVHNGIIENSEEIKEYLFSLDYEFHTETDTEVLLNLIEAEYLRCGKNLVKGIIGAIEKTEGSYAIAILTRDKPEEITICRKGSPLVIGIGKKGFYIASDIYAISDHTNRFIFPENGDIAVLGLNSKIDSFTRKGTRKILAEKQYFIEQNAADKNGFDNYMLKEINEQYEIISRLISKDLNFYTRSPESKNIDEVFKNTQRITILGCGTSWHAGLVGKYLIEKYVRIPVNTEYASEYRYRDPVIQKGDLVISISQSGETADTLAANQLARESGAITMGIINVKNSTLERETDFQLYLEAGPEIGVASTKAYTSQIVLITMMTSYLARIRNEKNGITKLQGVICKLPDLVKTSLSLSSDIKKIASKYSSSNNFLFLGRGLNYPSALEGALKLKEISYIHAEGYPGAEMKHGPIALIDLHFPTLAIATDTENYTKMISNIQEIKARSGKVIAIINESDKKIRKLADDYIVVPDMHDILSPVVSAIPLQLFAYHVALLRDCNVDQPRNLAKSVTVE